MRTHLDGVLFLNAACICFPYIIHTVPATDYGFACHVGVQVSEQLCSLTAR